MPHYRVPHSSTRLLHAIIGCVFILLLLVAPLAQAQSANASSAEAPVTLDQLADLLENNGARHQLIDQLRQAAAQNQSHGNTSATGEKTPDE